MLFGITRHHSAALARTAAVLVIGALAAGCSSANLTDGLTTNSTGGVTIAQAGQPYPGDRVPRPKEPVGMAVQNAAVTLPPPAAPVYSQPVQSAPAVGSSAVASAPLPPPSGSRTAAEQARPQQTQVAAATRAPEAPRSSAGGLAGGYYTVAAGDTLYAISRKTGVSVERLKQANGLSGETIRVGQKLTVPGAGGTAVAAAAPAPAKKPEPVRTAAAPAAAKPAAKEPEAPQVAAYTPPVEPKKAAEKPVSDEQVAALTPQSTGVDRLRWPVRGRVVTSFGAAAGGRASDGIDIAVPEGTSVHAAENGVVIYAGDGLKGFGNTVLVRHEDGLVTVYGHTSQMRVKRGDKVRRGQEIALSGMTGDADRPKLHFEVRKGTNPVDPVTYLE